MNDGRGLDGSTFMTDGNSQSSNSSYLMTEPSKDPRVCILALANISMGDFVFDEVLAFVRMEGAVMMMMMMMMEMS